jgi:hypothetical protein
MADRRKSSRSSRPAKSRPAARKPSRPSKPSRPARAAPAPRPPTLPRSAAPEIAPTAPEALGSTARRHLLSLSFLRDGDEFLARLETDAGQITELKNRSLDQLLSLVADDLEDLLE